MYSQRNKFRAWKLCASFVKNLSRTTIQGIYISLELKWSPLNWFLEVFVWFLVGASLIIPPYGGSVDYGPSRTYLSSRSTFRFPDIGYSGYCRVFQRNLSCFSLGSISVPNFVSRMPHETDFFRVGSNWNLKRGTFWPCQSSRNESIYSTRYQNKLDAFISCIYIANDSMIGLYSCLRWKMLWGLVFRRN